MQREEICHSTLENETTAPSQSIGHQTPSDIPEKRRLQIMRF